MAYFVVVASAKIYHHVLIAEEEHDGARVVQLVHDVEVGNLWHFSVFNMCRVVDKTNLINVA